MAKFHSIRICKYKRVSAKRSTLKSSSVNNIIFMNTAIYHNKYSL